MADAYALVPMDIAQELRQWAEALSRAEDWLPNSHGAAVLHRYKALLREQGEGHTDPKTVLGDFGYRLVGHGQTGRVRYFEAAERTDANGGQSGREGQS